MLADLDPRAKLLMAFGVSLLLLVASGKLALLLSFLLVFVLLLLSRMGKAGLIFIAAEVICLLLERFVSEVSLGPIGGLSGLMLFIIMKLIPMMMMGSWIATTVKVNDFIAAMDRIKLSKSVTISLAVTVRFLPTIKEEAGYIRDTMKMRNMDTSLRGGFLYPLKTMEYILIPLLMRSVKVADEMSAAALTRGLDRDNPRTSLREVRFGRGDLVTTLLFLGLLLGFGLLDIRFGQ